MSEDARQMMSPQDMLAAMQRIGDAAVVSLRNEVVWCAVRALVATHPDRDKLQAFFDQLLSQFQAHPGAVTPGDQSSVLRHHAAQMFQLN